MDFKRISGQAKKLFDQRGGTESLKGDLEELKTIAQGQGSLSDKAKAAADALKEPGRRDTPTEPEAGKPGPAEPATEAPEPEPAATEPELRDEPPASPPPGPGAA